MKDIKQIISECQNDVILELVQVLGIESTIKLLESFGGSQLYIPQIETLTKNEYRNSMIFTDFISGMSYRTIANKYELSEISIRKIVAVRKKNEQNKHGT